MNPTSFLKKAAASIISGLTTIALLLVLGNSGTLTWFPPVVVFSLVGISFFSSMVFPFIWHKYEAKGKINSTYTYAVLYGIIRYTLAFNLASFGWKKLFGLQFVVPDTVASMPMNTQSGEWLTWYYFGYSLVFGFIIAFIQIIGSLLILYRKTLLLGCIILFAFMLNLMLINIFYQMNTGALAQSILLTLSIFYLIMLDYKKLKEILFEIKSQFPDIGLNLGIKNAIRISAIVLSLLFTIYLKSLM